MLGGGNPVTGGSNPAGIGKSLNYIGKHAYAYSGAVNVDQTGSFITLLQFNTSNQYIVGSVILGRNDFTSDDIVLYIEFDDQIVGAFGSTSYTDAADQDINLVIPPFTKVRIAARNLSQDVDRECYAMITGEVYG